MGKALHELKKRYKNRRKKNSFYEDMSKDRKPFGSPNISGNFSNYSYHIDRASNKLMREELK